MEKCKVPLFMEKCEVPLFLEKCEVLALRGRVTDLRPETVSTFSIFTSFGSIHGRTGPYAPDSVRSLPGSISTRDLLS